MRAVDVEDVDRRVEGLARDVEEPRDHLDGGVEPEPRGRPEHRRVLRALLLQEDVDGEHRVAEVARQRERERAVAPVDAEVDDGLRFHAGDDPRAELAVALPARAQRRDLEGLVDLHAAHRPGEARAVSLQDGAARHRAVHPFPRHGSARHARSDGLEARTG